jgi:hypothetical protein
MKIVQDAQQKDPVGFKDAASKGPEALAAYLNGSTPDQSMSQTAPTAPTANNPNGITQQPYEPSSPESNPGEEFEFVGKESLAESSDFDRMKQFLTRLNG